VTIDEDRATRMLLLCIFIVFLCVAAFVTIGEAGQTATTVTQNFVFWYTFSKVLSVVTLYRRCTGALTLEKFFF
jgi:pheromone shutdown protein TraB